VLQAPDEPDLNNYAWICIILSTLNLLWKSLFS